jgi:hypothetical protein
LSPENPRAALTREAIRLHRRYQAELIDRFSVCPWAKPARSDGLLRTHVVIEATCDPAALATVVDGWVSDLRAEVAFVIVPRFEGDAVAFAAFAEAVGELCSDVFFAASFHPDVGATSSAIRFLRQTPDPTVQLVRRTRLEQIRAQDPPHYTDIFELDLRQLDGERSPRTVSASVLAHNERLLGREGRAALQAIIDDIRRDRDETYGRIFARL